MTSGPFASTTPPSPRGLGPPLPFDPSPPPLLLPVDPSLEPPGKPELVLELPHAAAMAATSMATKRTSAKRGKEGREGGSMGDDAQLSTGRPVLPFSSTTAPPWRPGDTLARCQGITRPRRSCRATGWI